MKRKVTLFTLFMFLCFSSGAILFSVYTNKIITEFNRIIEFHRIEDLRKNLILRTQTVQSNLHALFTPSSPTLDSMAADVKNLEEAAHACTGCHHRPELSRQIEEVQSLLHDYKHALSSCMTASANTRGINKLKLEAASIGNKLLIKSEEMSFVASTRLGLLTKDTLIRVNKARSILFLTIIITFLLGVAITALLARSITRPVNELLHATGEITRGRLGHRITYKDRTEFGELAHNFNLMSIALRDGYSKLQEEIAERRQTEEALVKSETFLHTILDSILDPFYILDKDFTIVRVNEAFASRRRKRVDDLIGRKCYEALRDKNTACDDCIASKTFSSGDPYAIERLETQQGGVETWTENRTYPILDRESQISHVIQYKRDITSHKLSEKALVNANNQLEIRVQERTADLISANEQLVHEISVREQTEKKLVKASDDWRITFDSTRDIILMLDSDLKIVKANLTASQSFERPFSEMIGRGFFDLLYGADMPLDQHPLVKMKQSKKHEEYETYFVEKDLWFLASADPILNDRGDIIGSVHIIRDITEQKKLYDQLLQAQKMESIGRLAGGIAHDFNNLLSAIIGYTELAMLPTSHGNQSKDRLKIVKEAAEKAAELTHQLLAFSRKQVLKMEVLNLNSIIEHMAKMLARVIREDIMLELHTTRPIRNIVADPVQIEQILMNLIINARDAMMNGGRLVIETSDIDLDDDYIISHENAKPGPYVMMLVSDTGIGMSRETQEKIFEPFFTTKGVGEGTGLGLATVYGIVKQHNGYINVYSEFGRGTTFRVYLPVSSDNVKVLVEKEQAPLARGEETVLVVDDDPSIRRLIKDILHPLGYRLLVASDGKEAMRIVDTQTEIIEALLTDVVMPTMNGKELSVAFRQKYPEAKVVFMSGYTDNTIAYQGILESGAVLIQKPLSPRRLANRLREILDGKT